MVSANGPLFDGLPVPPAEGLHASAPYWRALGEHRLVLQACASCGQTRTPPADVCYRCHSFESTWRDIAAAGTIFSWTRVWHAANESVATAVPYVLVWVVVDAESGARALGNLVDDPGGHLKIGAAVVGVFQDRDGGTVLNWRLADEAPG
jgi:uncharacterized OB-fold protein